MTTLECKAAGTVAAAEAAALSELLLGLCGCPPAAVRQHETLMKGPPRERTVPQLRLTHYLTALDCAPATSKAVREPRWSARHEGAPQRGKGTAELHCTVRACTVSACSGRKVLPFWDSLGYKPDFELLREGHRYLILLDGVEMQVSLTRIYKLGVWGEVGSAQELDPERALLEVTTTCDDGQQPTAGTAIGSLAELLLPYVELKKA